MNTAAYAFFGFSLSFFSTDPEENAIIDFFRRYLGGVFAKLLDFLNKIGISVKDFFYSLFYGFLDLIKAVFVEFAEAIKNTINVMFDAFANSAYMFTAGLARIEEYIVRVLFLGLYDKLHAVLGPFAVPVYAALVVLFFVAIYKIATAIIRIFALGLI